MIFHVNLQRNQVQDNFNFVGFFSHQNLNCITRTKISFPSIFIPVHFGKLHCACPYIFISLIMIWKENMQSENNVSVSFSNIASRPHEEVITLNIILFSNEKKYNFYKTSVFCWISSETKVNEFCRVEKYKNYVL